MPNIQDKDATARPQGHSVHLIERARTEVTGVRDVISFDESAVVLICDGFELEITGRGLKVSVLDVEKGCAVVDGCVDAVYYNEKKKPEHRGVLSRLFR